MKYLLIMVAILLSSVVTAQNHKSKPSKVPTIVLKGDILNSEGKTNVVLTTGFETIKYVKRSTRYKFKLEADKLYGVTFINGDKTKNIILTGTHVKKKYKIILDVDWGINDGETLFVRYNDSTQNYEYIYPNAGKK